MPKNERPFTVVGAYGLYGNMHVSHVWAKGPKKAVKHAHIAIKKLLGVNRLAYSMSKSVVFSGHRTIHVDDSAGSKVITHE